MLPLLHLISQPCKVKITYLHFTDRHELLGDTGDLSMLGRVQPRTRPPPTVRVCPYPPWRAHPQLQSPHLGLHASQPGPAKALQCAQTRSPFRSLHFQGTSGCEESNTLPFPPHHPATLSCSPPLPFTVKRERCHIVLLSPFSIRVIVDRNVSQKKMDAGYVP